MVDIGYSENNDGRLWTTLPAISQDMASLTFCVGDIFRPRAFVVSNLRSAFNCQSTGVNRTRISQLTTEILQRKHGPILRNLSTPQNFEPPLLQNINGDPRFLLLFTQPTGKPIFLQKLPNRKCSVFKLIAPENDRNWPILHDVARLTF